jgi:hypothetical protein
MKRSIFKHAMRDSWGGLGIREGLGGIAASECW